jgi:hypothetical protein
MIKQRKLIVVFRRGCDRLHSCRDRRVDAQRGRDRGDGGRCGVPLRQPRSYRAGQLSG